MSSALPVGSDTDLTVSSTFVFKEPAVTSTIAFKVQRLGQFFNAGMFIKCSATRPGSPWNFVSDVNQGWFNVPSADPSLDAFPTDWFRLSYTGALTTPNAVSSVGLFPNQCGLSSTQQLQSSNPDDTFFAFRKVVTQDPPCGTSSPSTSPVSSAPSISPTANPNTPAPSQSPTSSSPSLSPSTSVPSTTPSSSEPTGAPSGSPSRSPTISPGATSVPTQSPTCTIPQVSDIVWVLDSSSNMSSDAFDNITRFIESFSQQSVTMGPSNTRQGFLQFGGVSNGDVSSQTVYQNLNVTQAEASNVTAFTQLVRGLNVQGGSTNIAGALDFVREAMFSPSNLRPGSTRFVVLFTNGTPTDEFGLPTNQTLTQAVAATERLIQEDNVVFVVIRVQSTDYIDDVEPISLIYDSQYINLVDLLDQSFLCLPVTTTPSAAPTVCEPGVVTCCVSCYPNVKCMFSRSLTMCTMRALSTVHKFSAIESDLHQRV